MADLEAGTRTSVPELMSPAGHWPQLRAAVEAGADAVYFGLGHFSARSKVGFALDEVPDVMRELHGRAVRGYVTFNTLVFDDELTAARRALEALGAAGVDAVIVQDVAAVALAREVAPDVEVHGSTQMSITSAQGAELARSFGCARVVLGRELSLTDIARVRQATDVELEVFVHGALCVSYSGQCFSSEAWGGRSANRGQCAQACRLVYDLLVDGERRDLGEYRYLLSPGDLYALHQVPELARIGVSCLKIEGRYKDADYVALTTAAYREALDAYAAARPPRIGEAEERDLAQVYSRGLGPWFMQGTDHQQVVIGRAPRHRGVKVGEVAAVEADGVRVRAVASATATAAHVAPELSGGAVKPGDGVVFDAAHRRSPEEREEGGPVVRAEPAGSGEVRLAFLRGSVDLGRVAPGDWLWRTHDADVAAKARPYLSTAEPLYTRALRLEVGARVGAPLVITGHATGPRGEVSATVAGTAPLVVATRHGLDLEQARRQLGRLGGTPYHLGELNLTTTGEPFVPVSELNRLRRELVERLQAARLDVSARLADGTARNASSGAAAQRPAPGPGGQAPAVAPRTGTARAPGPGARAPNAGGRLHLLVRTPEQLDAVLEAVADRSAALPIASVTLDYLELYGLRPSVERAHEAGIAVRVASPRVLKPTEQNVVRFLLGLGAGILVRSGGLLHDLARLNADERPELHGDFSLNVTNAGSADAYLALGLSGFAPGHDLNGKQVAELAAAVGGEAVEVIAYHHLPVFHTEHCVFCRFLSDGHDFRDCGHPCETHRLALRDARGREHPVLADVGCRNTVFGGEAQVATKHLAAWWEAGVRDYRLEFVHEDAAAVLAVTRAFAGALAATASGDYRPALLEERLAGAVGATTEGSLYVPRKAAAVQL
ncbi:MAG: U32 family peptidase [Trueperaceae bacterium]|nr:U32 family peptidase [Trueperaceae bacterium]